jgi:hypothetical protein
LKLQQADRPRRASRSENQFIALPRGFFSRCQFLARSRTRRQLKGHVTRHLHTNPIGHPQTAFRRRVFAGFAALALFAPCLAWSNTFTINSDSDLRAALTTAQNPLRSFRWNLVRRLDEALSSYTTVSVESLYHQPQELADRLGRRFGLVLDAADLAGADPERESMMALPPLLRLGENADFAARAGITGFEIGQPYSTVSGELGCFALAEGWSHCEKLDTWSDGNRAALVLPLSSPPPRGAMISLRLNGYVVDGPWTTRIYVAGKLSKVITKSASDPRELTIDLLSPETIVVGEQSIVRVDFDFDTIMCPHDTDPSADARQLSLALKTFEIQLTSDDTAGAPAATSTALRSFIGRRSPRIALAMIGRRLSLALKSFEIPLTSDAAARTRAATSTALRPFIGRRSPRITLAVIGDDPELVVEAPKLLRAANLKGWLVLVCADVSQKDCPPAFFEQPFSVADRLENATGDELHIVAFGGTVSELLGALSARQRVPDLIVLWEPGAFRDIADALLLLAHNRLPDIAVLTSDFGFFFPMFWQAPDRYSKVFYPSNVVVGPQFSYFLN